MGTLKSRTAILVALCASLIPSAALGWTLLVNNVPVHGPAMRWQQTSAGLSWQQTDLIFRNSF